MQDRWAKWHAGSRQYGGPFRGRSGCRPDDRGVRGTTPWTRYQIEHDVDADATSIAFGGLLTGDGTAWFDTFAIEVDGKPLDEALEALRQPKAVLPLGWGKAASNGGEYDVGIDRDVTHAGKAAAYVKPVVAKPAPEFFGNLMQSFRADDYRGKRVRLSAFVKTHKVPDSSMLWMRVDGATRRTLGFDNMQNRPLKGTADWKKYEIVLDVPEASVGIAFGVMLIGKGQVWVDDLALSLVGKDVPTTDLGVACYPTHGK